MRSEFCISTYHNVFSITATPSVGTLVTMASESKDVEADGIAIYSDPVISHSANGEQSDEIDEAYLHQAWLPKTFRGVLFQMVLFGA